MNRLLAVILLALPTVAFSQSPKGTEGTSSPSTKPAKTASSNSQEFNLSDLLTNARLKVQKVDPCPDSDHYQLSDKLLGQAVQAKTQAQRDALMKKADEVKQAEEKKPCRIDGTAPYISYSGIWESEAPGVFLMSPEQVWIVCDAQEKQCKIVRVRFD